MVSAWGGYVFIINLIPLHALVLLVMGRYSNRIYRAYTTFFFLGLVLSMWILFVTHSLPSSRITGDDYAELIDEDGDWSTPSGNFTLLKFT